MPLIKIEKIDTTGKSATALFWLPIIFIVCLICGIGVFNYPASEWLILEPIVKRDSFLAFSAQLAQNYPGIFEPGRYHISNGLHLNLLTLISDQDYLAIVYGGLQASVYLLFCWIIWLLYKTTGSNLAALTITAIILISPQITYMFMHPMLEESMLSLGFIFMIYAWHPNVRADRHRAGYLSFFSVVITIASKITSIVLVVPYAIYSLVVGARKTEIIVILMALVGWMYLCWHFRGGMTGEDHERLNLIRDTFFYYARTDPLLLAFIAFLLLEIAVSNPNVHDMQKSWADAAFIGGFAYLCLAIIFGKHSQYHAAPVYTAIIPSIFLHIKRFRIAPPLTLRAVPLWAAAALLCIAIYATQQRTVFWAAALALFVLATNLTKTNKLNWIAVFRWTTILLYAYITYRATRLNVVLGVVLASLPISAARVFQFIPASHNYFGLGVLVREGQAVKHAFISAVTILFFSLVVFGFNGLNSAIWHLQSRQAFDQIKQLLSFEGQSGEDHLLSFKHSGNVADVPIHAYTFAKTFIGASGMSIRVVARDCELLPDFEETRLRLSVTYARDFSQIVAPCTQSNLDNAVISVIYAGLEDQPGWSGILRRVNKFSAYDELQDPIPRISLLRK